MLSYNMQEVELVTCTAGMCTVKNTAEPLISFTRQQESAIPFRYIFSRAHVKEFCDACILERVSSYSPTIADLRVPGVASHLSLVYRY